MSLPGGIRTTLAVALLLIVGGALGGAYLMVVPSLERRLVAERLDELQSDAEATAYSYTRADARGDFSDAAIECGAVIDVVGQVGQLVLCPA